MGSLEREAPGNHQRHHSEQLTPESLTKVWRIIPIAIILGLLTGAGQTTVLLNEAGEVVRRMREIAGGLASSLAVATALMLIVRQRYPRWWFDFARELTRFGYRVGAYLVLLTDPPQRTLSRLRPSQAIV